MAHAGNGSEWSHQAASRGCRRGVLSHAVSEPAMKTRDSRGKSFPLDHSQIASHADYVF